MFSLMFAAIKLYKNYKYISPNKHFLGIPKTLSGKLPFYDNISPIQLLVNSDISMLPLGNIITVFSNGVTI